MQRLRLKADGRIVELRDGREFPLAPAMPSAAPAVPSPQPRDGVAPAVRDLRRRARLTQLEFAARLGVPSRPSATGSRASACRADRRGRCSP